MPAPRGLVGRRAVQVAAPASLELRPAPARLLTIGSLVAFGSVGLNAAHQVGTGSGVPAAQLPTVLYPVLPHYDSARPLDVPAGWISTALADLTAAGVLQNLELITAGYLATIEQAESVARWYAQVPWHRPPRFVLDPTLGDTELGFYTDPALVGAVRDHLLPLSHGITPNLFELAHLAGCRLDELTTIAAIESAARGLMHRRTEWVVVTGVRAPSRAGEEGAEIGELIVVRSGFTFRRHPYLPTQAKGLGDLFTARLNLALLAGDPITTAVDAAAQAVQRCVTPG